jgi:hypothetical protein
MQLRNNPLHISKDDRLRSCHIRELVQDSVPIDAPSGQVKIPKLEMRVRFPSPAPFNPMLLRAKSHGLCCATMLAILATPNTTGMTAASHAERAARRTPTSKFLSNQASYPYEWAPLQLLAVEGLRRCGYAGDVNRISYKFLSMIHEDFESEEHIREKYDVVTRESVSHIRAGYITNQIGFGWTNGVFLELLHELPPEQLARLTN